MMESLISVTNLKDYISVLSDYTEQLGDFTDFYLCLCDNWDNLGETDDTVNYLKNGYSKKMILPLYRGSNEAVRKNVKMFYSSEMLPGLKSSREEPKAFFFSPVHYNDRCFGYSAISFGNKITSYNETYSLWMRCVHNTLETLRRQRNLSYMYKCMVKNAVTDALTGVYNRNGFNQFAEEMLFSAQQLNENLLVILGDLNDLKYINDNFSHLEGDFAIKTAAAAFKNSCLQNEACFRYGGDEFLIISSGNYSQEQIENIKKQIAEELNIANSVYSKPYTLSVSIGVFYGPAAEISGLEEALSVADNDMFHHKVLNKKQ